jgi:hypothetical protein
LPEREGGHDENSQRQQTKWALHDLLPEG